MSADTHDAARDEVVVESALEASHEKVWRALSVPELAAEWLGAAHGPSGPGTGSTFEIIEALPFTRLTYRWRDQAPSTESIVTIEIEPLGPGETWFRLTHAAPKARLVAANGNTPMAIVA